MRAFRKKLIAALLPKILNKLAKLIAPSKGIKSENINLLTTIVPII